MAISLQLRSRPQALADVAASLQVQGAGDLLTIGILATQLRATCEAYGARERVGVHTLRLVEAVIRNSAGLFDADLDVRATAHETLKNLEASGDLWKSAGGYWQPTPPRAVVSPSGHAFLLGASDAGAKAYSVLGTTRFIRGKVPFGTATQQFDDWLGHEASIETWMDMALRAYKSRLQIAELLADHLEIYAPDQAKRLGRSSWIDAASFEASTSDLRLCRAFVSSNAFYSRPYYLGEFAGDSRGLRLVRAVPVLHEHARRFRFGFDHRLSARRFVRVKRQADACFLTIANDLPPEERRVLSLGWRSGEPSSPATQSLVFPSQAMPFVAHAFARLGVLVEGETS